MVIPISLKAEGKRWSELRKVKFTVRLNQYEELPNEDLCIPCRVG